MCVEISVVGPGVELSGSGIIIILNPETAPRLRIQQNFDVLRCFLYTLKKKAEIFTLC